MNCETARQLWHRECDGELGVEERASLELHLRSCGECEAFATQMGALMAALDDLRVSSESAGMRAAPRRSRRGRLRAFGSLAAAVVLLIGAVALMERGSVSEIARRSPATPAPTQAPDQATRILLMDRSAENYIPVVQETNRANVHLILLYDATN